VCDQSAAAADIAAAAAAAKGHRLCAHINTLRKLAGQKHIHDPEHVLRRRQEQGAKLLQRYLPPRACCDSSACASAQFLR
jgi:hypothetical protein